VTARRPSSKKFESLRSEQKTYIRSSSAGEEPAAVLLDGNVTEERTDAAAYNGRSDEEIDVKFPQHVVSAWQRQASHASINQYPLSRINVAPAAGLAQLQQLTD